MDAARPPPGAHPNPRAGGRGDGRRAAELPPDIGLRHGRAGTRLRKGVPVKWPLDDIQGAAFQSGRAILLPPRHHRPDSVRPRRSGCAGCICAGLRVLWQDVELMPLQNRVDPFGNLIRTPARGTMMGNRGGALHNADQEIVRSYKSRRWITCVLEFRGRHREVMSRNRYTELFFIDEAVASAAGHRPCAECRRERYNAFRDAWARAKQQNDRPSADEMDLELHPARIDKRKKVTYETPLRLLPDGCFVQIVGDAYLVLGDALLLWTPGGYARREARPQGSVVTVLTPRPIVRSFREGYQPEIHESLRFP